MVVHNYCVSLIYIIWVFFAFSDVLANITVDIRENNHNNITSIYPEKQCGSDFINVKVKENSFINITYISNKYVNEVWCSNLEYGSQSNIPVERSTNGYITTVYFRAVDNNEGLLNCTFLTDRGTFRYGDTEAILWNYHTYKKTYCPVRITIEYILHMTISNEVTNTSSVQKEDGKYYFKDGDSLSIVCSRPVYKRTQLPTGTTISLCHCKAVTNNCTCLKNDKEVAAIQTSSATKLKTDQSNDKDDVICDFKSYRLVTRLVLVPDEPPTIIIKDKIEENTFDNSTGPNIYKGTTGENVGIVCRKNEKSGTLRWDYCKNIERGLSCLTKENDGMEIEYAGLNLNQTLNNTVIKCVFTNVNRRKTITSVLLDIKPEGERHLTAKGETGCWQSGSKNDKNSTPPPVQHVPVTSAPFTTAPKFPSHEDGNITLNTAKSEFAFNEVLNFSCSACYDNLSIYMYIKTPDNNKTEVNVKYDAKNKQDKKNNCRKYEVSYKMNFNESVQINCEARESKEVLGRETKLLKLVQSTTTDTTATATVSTIDAKGNDIIKLLNGNQTSQQSDDFTKTGYFWVAIVVGILLIIIFIIITVKVCKSKKSDQEKDHEDVTYMNLSNEMATPPFPKNAKLEETYLKPSDCRVTDNVTYALPYIETNIENLYSKPLPKSQRNFTEVMPKNIQTNETTYAEIESSSNNGRKQIANTTEYSTIQDLNPNYTNVFVNEPYVNTKNTLRNDDYAEPSYCEIGKLIKE